VESCNALISYFFDFGLLVTLACIIALPEMYPQWDIGGIKHPVLYEVIRTTGGLDVTMIYLSVLSGALLIFTNGMQSKAFNYLLYSCVAITVVLLILIASKSVILSTILTLLIFMGISNNYPRQQRFFGTQG